MTRPKIGETIIRRASVASTMDEVRSFAVAGAPEGTVVVAEHQTAGRGRAGRQWTESPGDGLLMSVLLRPPIEPRRLSLLPLVIGVAVAEAIEIVAPVVCQLKWPNDVWITSHKVAGILITTEGQQSEPTVIVGVGINVNTPADRLPEGAISIGVASSLVVDRDVLLGAVTSCLNARYAHFLDFGGGTALTEWRNRAALVGQRVRIVHHGERLIGVYRGVDEDGALLLEMPDGEHRRVVSGDLVRGPILVP